MELEALDEIVHEFLVESYENLDQLDRDLVALESEPGSRELLSSVFRTIHTIKGTSGFLAFNRLERLTHAGEGLLVELRDGHRAIDPPTTDVLLGMVDTVRAILATIEADGVEGDVAIEEIVDRIHAVLAAGRGGEELSNTPPAPSPAPSYSPPGQPSADEVTGSTTHSPADNTPHNAADSSIRVDVDLLDALMREVGELVLARNQITRLADTHTDPELVRASQRLSLIASELQDSVMRTRMQPIDHLWSTMPRIVRDLATQCGREVRLERIGGDTELDRSLLEAVKDPLTHLVRNAVDHGIEPPQERVAVGKPARGTLTLRASHAGGQVIVEVSDDGRGIDPDDIAAVAIARGLRRPEQIATMAPGDIIQLLFVPGFSTAEQVTNISGRGVGLDVVRTKIEAIGGAVEVESHVGQGTTWRLRIPLTLAIMPALTVESSGECYAIPQVNLLEVVALDGQRAGGGIEHVHSAPVYRLRGSLLPLVDLRSVLGDDARLDSDASGVIAGVIAVLATDSLRFGLIVDRVLDTEEIVVKPLSARLKSIGLYAGATLLGDGHVSLILDVQAIARRVRRVDTAESAQQAATLARDEHDSEVEQLLVTDIGDGRRVAIPLATVTRLERIARARVELVGGREVVQYRGGIMPVCRLGRLLGAAEAPDGDEVQVVVCGRDGQSVALVVDEIVDIVTDEGVRRSPLADTGLVGSAVLAGRVTELLDVPAALRAVDQTAVDPPPPSQHPAPAAAGPALVGLR